MSKARHHPKAGASGSAEPTPQREAPDARDEASTARGEEEVASGARPRASTLERTNALFAIAEREIDGALGEFHAEYAKEQKALDREGDGPPRSAESPTLQADGAEPQKNSQRRHKLDVVHWALIAALAVALRGNLGAKDEKANVVVPEAAEIEAEEEWLDEATEGPLPEGWLGATDEVWPLPAGWEDFGFGHIRRHFHCKEYANDHTKPLPTEEDWDVFKTTYQEVVDASAIFDDPVSSTEGYTLGNGRPTPFYAAHGERGRGLFASRDIRKGELVFDGARSEVMFPSGDAWRKYVFSLPRNKACDQVDWTWTTTEGDGQLHAYTAMNIAVLCNGGDGEEANVGDDPDAAGSLQMYALRDIEKGEEILEEYDDVTEWEEVGL